MSRLYVGVDLGGTNIRSGLVDEKGNILQHDCRPTRVPEGRDAILGGMIDGIREVARKGDLRAEELAGIGVGAPGPLNPFEGVIVSPENLPPLYDTPLRAILKKEFGVPVAIDNDANVVAFGEQWMGAGKGVDNFLCVTLGTGVGGGCVSQGKLLRGFNGNAAEIGHSSIDYRGPPMSLRRIRVPGAIRIVHRDGPTYPGADPLLARSDDDERLGRSHH